MADQGIWFKLWTTALHDPDLANLALEDFARWALLGTYIKAHGTGGRLRLTPPARALCALLQVANFDGLLAVFRRLPNVIEEGGQVTVTGETNTTVSHTVYFRNWSKYQGDFSTHRVRKFRAKHDSMKRSKRRGEEKRGEEKRIVPLANASVAEGPAAPAESDNHLPDPEQVQETWNRLCGQVAGNVRKLTATRRRQIRVRSNEGLRPLSRWETLFTRAMNSAYLRSDKARWFSFDWLLANDTNWVKVMEGKYA